MQLNCSLGGGGGGVIKLSFKPIPGAKSKVKSKSLLNSGAWGTYIIQFM